MLLILFYRVVLEHFVKDPTFNHSYKRGHTNMTSYILGLSLGLIIYKLQQKQLDVENFKVIHNQFAAYPTHLDARIISIALFLLES